MQTFILVYSKFLKISPIRVEEEQLYFQEKLPHETLKLREKINTLSSIYTETVVDLFDTRSF